MKDRVGSIGTVAGLLFVVYTLGQFTSWLTRKSHHADGIQLSASVVVLTAIAVITGAAAYRAIVRAPSVDALPPVLVALVAGCAASVLIGPFADGTYPFKTGPGDFFQLVWIFLGAGLVGVALGAWTAMGLGKDYRSVALKRFAEARHGKPARSVRR